MKSFHKLRSIIYPFLISLNMDMKMHMKKSFLKLKWKTLLLLCQKVDIQCIFALEMIKPDEHLAQSLSSTLRENLPLRNKIFIISNYKCYCCQDNFSHEGYDSKIVFNNFFKISILIYK